MSGLISSSVMGPTGSGKSTVRQTTVPVSYPGNENEGELRSDSHALFDVHPTASSVDGLAVFWTEGFGSSDPSKTSHGSTAKPLELTLLIYCNLRDVS